MHDVFYGNTRVLGGIGKERGRYAHTSLTYKYPYARKRANAETVPSTTYVTCLGET